MVMRVILLSSALYLGVALLIWLVAAFITWSLPSVDFWNWAPLARTLMLCFTLPCVSVVAVLLEKPSENPEDCE